MILKLKRIRSSCKYIRVHWGLSSSVVCIASVSIWFRRKEWEWKTAQKMAPSFILQLSFHFSHSQNRKSHSSVFLCSETKRKRLLHRLVVLWCIIVIDKLAFITGVIISRFLGKWRPCDSAKWARSVRHTQWRKTAIVCRQALFFCAFPIIGVSHSKPTLCRLLLAWKTRRKNVTLVMQAVGKQTSFS